MDRMGCKRPQSVAMNFKIDYSKKVDKEEVEGGNRCGHES